MIVCGVDLAQKMSAYCVWDGSTILAQAHSMTSLSDAWFIKFLVDSVAKHGVDKLVVEDLPHGLGFNKIIKDVSRLQGRIEQECFLQRTVLPTYVQPQAWMLWYKINGKGSAARVLPRALEDGYVPPIRYQELHHQERARAKKAQTDYAAAYLISRWAYDTTEAS